MIQRVHRPPLWEAVLEGMRDAILSGELPAGEKLVEADLATRFGTSRGPIREAVRELVREGLIVEYPRRGHVISTLTAGDLAEVYGVRAALEAEAVKQVIERGDGAVLDELEQQLDALERGHEYLKNIVYDLAFHRALVGGSSNERMTTINEQMLLQTAHLVRTAAAANPTLQSTVRRSAHRDILDALVAHDVRAAQTAVAAHYQYAGERSFPALEWFSAGFGAW